MSRTILFFMILWVAVILPNLLQAQVPTMQIKGEQDKQNSAVSLKSADIQVEVVGNIATTTMKLVFHNHSSRILEGELSFPLPDGVSVSRYAIDINGKLRDAVPVSKAKATEVFESIEHRRIDPGLMERVEGNNFRTRVYPLPAGGERTVLIAYEEILSFKENQALQYHLPLSFDQALPTFYLQVKVFQSSQKPKLIEQPDDSFRFSENKNSTIYEASIQKKDYKPGKSLTIEMPKDINIPEVALQKNFDGSYYFLVHAFPKKTSYCTLILWT